MTAHTDARPEDETTPTLQEILDTLEYARVKVEFVSEKYQTIDAKVLRWLQANVAALLDTQEDTRRLDWLEARTQEDEHATLNFTEAWTEPGDYGSILSQGPREFWLRDDMNESGPTLRAAIDNARRAAASALPGAEPT